MWILFIITYMHIFWVFWRTGETVKIKTKCLTRFERLSNLWISRGNVSTHILFLCDVFCFGGSAYRHDYNVICLGIKRYPIHFSVRMRIEYELCSNNQHKQTHSCAGLWSTLHIIWTGFNENRLVNIDTLYNVMNVTVNENSSKGRFFFNSNKAMNWLNDCRLWSQQWNHSRVQSTKGKKKLWPE